MGAVRVLRVCGALAAVMVAAGCGAAPSPAVPSATRSSPSSSVGPVADQDFQMRPVLSVGPAPAGGCPTRIRPEPVSKSPIRACSVEGTQQYTLGPAAVIGSHVVTIAVDEVPPDRGVAVDMTLDSSGSAALAAVTGELSMQSPPRSQLAFYVLGQVSGVSAVTEPIEGSSVRILGLSTSEAQQLVSKLKTR